MNRSPSVRVTTVSSFGAQLGRQAEQRGGRRFEFVSIFLSPGLSFPNSELGTRNSKLETCCYALCSSPTDSYQHLVHQRWVRRSASVYSAEAGSRATTSRSSSVS